jgi:hypothetical protein
VTAATSTHQLDRQAVYPWLGVRIPGTPAHAALVPCDILKFRSQGGESTSLINFVVQVVDSFLMVRMLGPTKHEPLKTWPRTTDLCF